MLSAVRPNFSDNKITISMTVLGRRTEDIDEFIEKLEATGAFDDVVPAQQDTTEEGLHRLLLETVYTGRPAPAAAVPAGASAPPASEAGSAHGEAGGGGAARARRARKGGPMTDLRRIVLGAPPRRLHPRRGARHQRRALRVWWCIRWRSGCRAASRKPARRPGA